MSIENIYKLVEEGRTKAIQIEVKKTLEEGCSPTEILNEGMIAAMDAVGMNFKDGKIFVPEMLASARTMKKGVEILKPYLVKNETTKMGKIIIGTVEGDLHDIGKNLVAMMLESTGFEVIDLGIDVSKERFIEAIEKNPEVKIVCCSALLTTTMPALKEIVETLNGLSIRKNIKIMVGGFPVTQDFSDEIGADAYTKDAAECAQIAKKLGS